MDEEIKELVADCYRKSPIFNKTFLAESFNTPYSPLHYEVMSALDCNAQRVVISAPRNLGKTSLARALAIQGILYRDYEFILYVSNAETLSMMQTENIKRELTTNREIKKVFGSVKVTDFDEEMDESFSKHSWVAFGNTLVMPRGSNQQVRGFIYANTRPQLIIVDDFEDKRELTNPEIRRKNKDWFWTDLYRCVDRYSKKWRIIYIDTLKHADSLLEELLNDPDWLSLRLEAFDDAFNSNVPYLYSNEEIKKEVEAARRNGTLDQLYMELRSMPIARENASFLQEFFKYYDEIDLFQQDAEIENVVILDPAKTAQIQSADSAIVGIGVNYKNGAIYIRDVVSGKMFPEQIYENTFQMAKRLRARVIGVEVTGLEEFIKQPMTNHMMMKDPSYNFELVWLKARGGSPDGERGKIKRIGGLVPYYRQGFVYHNRTCCGKLEAQLLSFPRSGLVDVADATAYVIELLELGDRYFQNSPPDTNEEGGDTDFDEFAELDYEEPLEGSWRLV
jgi:hypothetical protein